jgi:hypothetical protein
MIRINELSAALAHIPEDVGSSLPEPTIHVVLVNFGK